MKCTELSKYIWSLKNQGITPTVKWIIVNTKVNNKDRITANHAQRKSFLSVNLSTTAIC